MACAAPIASASYAARRRRPEPVYTSEGVDGGGQASPADDTVRVATTDVVKDLCREARALQECVADLTRSALYRCLQRHGISHMPDVEGDKPRSEKCKCFSIGFFHIDLAEV